MITPIIILLLFIYLLIGMAIVASLTSSAGSRCAMADVSLENVANHRYGRDIVTLNKSYLVWAFIPPYPHNGRVLYDAVRWPEGTPWAVMADSMSPNTVDYGQYSGATKVEVISKLRHERATYP